MESEDWKARFERMEGELRVCHEHLRDAAAIERHKVETYRRLSCRQTAIEAYERQCAYEFAADMVRRVLECNAE